MSDYCTRGADIEARYGVQNVRKWADMDNDGDATKIEARVVLAIQNATGLIDDRLRGGPYAVPLTFDPMSRTIVMACVIFAADDMYTSRGVSDQDAEGNPVHRLRPERRDAEAMLDGIMAGKIRLDASASSDTPPTGVPAAVSFRRRRCPVVPGTQEDAYAHEYILRTDSPLE